MTPEALLSQVGRMLAPEGAPVLRGVWPRACAALTRLALERSLDRFWAVVEPDAAACGMRTQLLILPGYADPEVATSARETWYGLCRVAHHHAYELSPTAAELRGWHDTVARLAQRLDAVWGDARPVSRC